MDLVADRVAVSLVQHFGSGVQVSAMTKGGSSSQFTVVASTEIHPHKLMDLLATASVIDVWGLVPCLMNTLFVFAALFGTTFAVGVGKSRRALRILLLSRLTCWAQVLRQAGGSGGAHACAHERADAPAAEQARAFQPAALPDACGPAEAADPPQVPISRCGKTAGLSPFGCLREAVPGTRRCGRAAWACGLWSVKTRGGCLRLSRGGGYSYARQRTSVPGERRSEQNELVVGTNKKVVGGVEEPPSIFCHKLWCNMLDAALASSLLFVVILKVVIDATTRMGISPGAVVEWVYNDAWLWSAVLALTALLLVYFPAQRLLAGTVVSLVALSGAIVIQSADIGDTVVEVAIVDFALGSLVITGVMTALRVVVERIVAALCDE